MARAVARDMGVSPRLRFLRGGRASMPVAAGIFRPAVIMPADADTLVGEPASRGAAARAGARQAARLPHACARPGGVRFPLVQPAGLAGGEAGADRARARLRRPGAGLRHPRLRLRRSAARDGARAARRSLPGAARRRQPGDGAPVATRRPVDRDPRSSPAPLRHDPRPCARGGRRCAARRLRRSARSSPGRRTADATVVVEADATAHAAFRRTAGPGSRPRRGRAVRAAGRIELPAVPRRRKSITTCAVTSRRRGGVPCRTSRRRGRRRRAGPGLGSRRRRAATRWPPRSQSVSSVIAGVRPGATRRTRRRARSRRRKADPGWSPR